MRRFLLSLIHLQSKCFKVHFKGRDLEGSLAVNICFPSGKCLWLVHKHRRKGGFYYVMFVNNANLLSQVPPLRQLSTKDSINGLLVQSAYDVIISKIMKETIFLVATVGSISRIVQKHHYSLGNQSKNYLSFKFNCCSLLQQHRNLWVAHCIWPQAIHFTFRTWPSAL